MKDLRHGNALIAKDIGAIPGVFYSSRCIAVTPVPLHACTQFCGVWCFFFSVFCIGLEKIVTPYVMQAPSHGGAFLSLSSV